jgi:hypothetical protein
MKAKNHNITWLQTTSQTEIMPRYQLLDSRERGKRRLKSEVRSDLASAERADPPASTAPRAREGIKTHAVTARQPASARRRPSQALADTGMARGGSGRGALFSGTGGNWNPRRRCRDRQESASHPAGGNFGKEASSNTTERGRRSVRSSTTPTTPARTSSPAPISKVDTSRLSRVPADYGGPHSDPCRITVAVGSWVSLRATV